MHMCECVYACLHVYMCECVYACLHVYMCECMYACLHVYMCECMYACLHVCTCVSVCACLHVYMCECMYACLHVYMCECMCACLLHTACNLVIHVKCFGHLSDNGNMHCKETFREIKQKETVKNVVSQPNLCPNMRGHRSTVPLDIWQITVQHHFLARHKASGKCKLCLKGYKNWNHGRVRVLLYTCTCARSSQFYTLQSV